MALDAGYVTTVSLEEYFVDKDSGTPNSFGTIEFWQDDNRVVPKNVFELTGAPPNYTYSPLPNPITLSAVGTPSDANGNNIAIYYFPYDALGNVQLYYVVVRDQFGTIQETREAWPNTTASNNPAQQESGLFNQLVNPQFAFVNFLPNNPLTITNSAGAGTYNYSNIIPGWILNVTYTGNGSTQVQRTSIAGTSQYPGNPPYTISITPGANVSGITLTQTLTNNPNIFAPANGGVNGYLASSILLAPGSSIMMFYQPNGQASQQILAANNTSGVYTEYDNTVQLLAANNANTADTGFVTIILQLPIVGTTTFSNVQIVGVNSNIQGITFYQETVVQQMNQMFNYFNPQLSFKAVPSYLIGWEFAKNPAQFLSTTVGTFATGANTSNYVWDQTIVFQTANSGFSTVQGPSGALVLTAAANTQLAIIQYLEAPSCSELLYERLCSMVEAVNSGPNPVTSTISLWTTTGALPNIAANASLVTGLDANGFPTVAGGWTQVQRGNLGNAQFSITLSGSTPNQIFNYYPFNGWKTTAAVASTATFFAIVVGTSTITAAQNVSIQSISLQPGDIPTIPGPQSADAVLNACKRYYQKSFIPSVVPSQASASSLGMYSTGSLTAANQNQSLPSVLFPVQMRVTPTIVTYNPISANAQFRDFGANIDCSATQVNQASVNGFGIQTNDNGGGLGNTLGVHWTADSRLGL